MSIWPLGRPGNKRELNIKTDLQEDELGSIHWIDLDQDRYGRRTFVNAVMNFRDPWTAGNWLADNRLGSQERFCSLEWLREWVRCQFECNFRSLTQQICFNLTQIRIHCCCSVSVVMTLQFAQKQFGFFTGWPNLDITRCLHLCINICGYFELSFWLLEFQWRAIDCQIYVKRSEILISQFIYQ